jgi:A/G-specific adenine glycosylase
VDAFPTVFDLAKAQEEEVLKLWQGLGYYSRARNLHFSAKYIVETLKGAFPSSYEGLLQLKGVGDYTASAIASICFDETTAVVDGNVYRVLSRYFGLATPINSTKGVKEFKELAQTLIDSERSGTYNQAIMDFGALHCKPQNPLCDSCPLKDSCVALQKKQVKLLPVKEKKIKITNRYFNYLVLVSEKGETILQQRKGKGIWQNLYEFPLIESPESIDEKLLVTHEKFQGLFKDKKVELSLFNEKEVVHKLSHQHLYTRFWIVKSQGNEACTVSWKEVAKFPVPALIHKFIEEFNSN